MANPERRKALTEKYRRTPRGRRAWARRNKRWKQKNKWCARERASRERAGLTDFYVKTLLKRRGVKSPTAEQIEAERRFVRALRAARVLKVMAYGSGI